MNPEALCSCTQTPCHPDSPFPQSIMKHNQKLAALTHKREGQMGTGRGVSRRETPMVWFARLLCLDHCLPITPRGVVEALHLCCSAVLQKGPREGWGVGPEGGSHWRTEKCCLLWGCVPGASYQALLGSVRGCLVEDRGFRLFPFSFLSVETGSLYVVGLVVLELAMKIRLALNSQKFDCLSLRAGLKVHTTRHCKVF